MKAKLNGTSVSFVKWENYIFFRLPKTKNLWLPQNSKTKYFLCEPKTFTIITALRLVASPVCVFMGKELILSG